jgi:hypothetical protein
MVTDAKAESHSDTIHGFRQPRDMQILVALRFAGF